MQKIYIDTCKYKTLLSKTMEYSEKTHLPDDVVEKIASFLTSLTIATTTPDTESEKMFYSMWKNADKSEKQMLSKMLIRIVKES